MIDQFLLEVKIQQFCNHPNILSLHGVFDDTDNVYILLEYMEEGTLFLHLKKNATLN
jgi:serine/threonine protein kinase